MSGEHIIDTESGEVTAGEVVYYNPPAPVTLFQTNDPAEVVKVAAATAEALADVIRAKHLYKTIGSKNHVFVEAWTMLGTMLGVFPIVEWTRAIEGGWEARVEARTKSGDLVGAAESQCTRSEKTWANRDDYALRSMAQTRATSRALRGPLGFIVELAGYSATAAEEMPSDGPNQSATGADTKLVTKPQLTRLFTLLTELDKKEGVNPPEGESWEEYTRAYSSAPGATTPRRS